jgi:exodeoxyribonuclease VII small subunit
MVLLKLNQFKLNMKKTEKTTKGDLKENMKELASIVSWFENQEDLDLEKALEQVKLGAELIKESKDKLKDIENQFKEIKKGLSE